MTLKPEIISFDKEWSFLVKLIDKVINVEQIDRKEWTEGFSTIYRICVANPESLWEKLYFQTQEYIDQYVVHLFKEFENLPSNELLKQYHLKWNSYRKGVDYLNELYLYLNTQHVKKQKFSDPDISYGNIKINEQKLEIRELGLYFWEKNMIEPLKDKLVYLLLEATENDRLGKECDENIIKDIVLSFVDVEVYTKKHELYETVFERPFLKATGEFYKKEAELLVQTCNCSEYMEKAQQRLSAESLRSTKFLHQSSYNKVREECENRMIADHLTLLHSECKNMVLSEAKKDLKNMYLLLKNVKDGLPVFIKEIQNYITDIGLNSVSNYLIPNDQSTSSLLESKDSPTFFVENILEVHHKFYELIKEVFNSDQQFVRALDKACSTIINHKKNSKYPCKAPELLARYCDSLLKKSANKGLNESEIDDKLTMSIVVFRYIDDKDVFQKFYSKMLGKRLIHSLSISMDSEESMINKLKQACGHEFTSKLHRMFTDIRVSGDLIKQFNSWCNLIAPNEPQLSIGFNIFVLQAGAWPIYPAQLSPFELPLSLEQCVTKFEKFYYQKFNGRKLTWLHYLSTCDVKMYLDKKTYLITMSCYLMAILTQFNRNLSKLTYQYLQENTKITDEQLSRHLILLVDTKLLSLEPNLSNYNNLSKFDSEQLFVLNLDYVNKRTKFRLAILPPKETSQQIDIEQTQASVDENRKLYLQAVIVRVMKSRKIIKHNILVQEVTQLTNNRFTPSLQMIKICIEALIEKQYLERTSSTDEYSYVA